MYSVLLPFFNPYSLTYILSSVSILVKSPAIIYTSMTAQRTAADAHSFLRSGCPILYQEESNMSSSSFGKLFRITTWGESHGPGIGVVIDGVPAGLSLSADDIQYFLDRRKPGASRYATKRSEADRAEILSGVFEGKTTGTPISVIIRNTDQRSHDYSLISEIFRPGHADYPYTAKYGIRDYRGGGRSSGRETIGRVAAGAVAAKLLEQLDIHVQAYARSIGPYSVCEDEFDMTQIYKNPFCIPAYNTAREIEQYMDTLMERKDSAGGIIECIADGIPAGIGEPVFDKLDALIAQAVMSIGAVKSVEIGDGISVSTATGSENNDPFYMDAGRIAKRTNHAGGVLGGMSDGSRLFVRASVKPTPSIAQPQHSVTLHKTDTDLTITGRHDPVIVPRAVVVVESMVSIVLCDLLLQNMGRQMDHLKLIYGSEKNGE